MGQKFTVPVSIKQLGSAGSEAFTIYVDADSYARLKVDAGGKLTWGSGSATGDTTLYRSAADTLKTDDSFEATGSVTANGKISTSSYLESTASAGNEGGEIQLAKPATNSSISGNVVIDIYQNQLRFFESTGTNRGAYIDITAASTGVGSNLLTGGGGGATTLDGLTDVTAPSPSSGDFLKYNGSAWVNDPIDLSTDTTGSYVASLVAGTNVTLANNSGEAATPTVTVSGALTSIDSVSSPDFVQFDTSVGSPASVEGKLQWDSDFGTLSFGLEGNNSVQQIGINQFAYCYNAEATTLNKGEAVYIFGGQGSQVSIKRAENTSDTTSARTLGLVSESIASGASGYVCTYGVLQGLNTSAYTVGDILYLGATAGTLTTTAPSAPNHYVFIGVVIKADVGGEIWVRPQNGYELNEIHNVQITTPASGDFLKYNGTLWVNDPINLGTDTVGNYMTDVSAGTGVTVTHTPAEGSTATIAIGQAVATTDSPTFAGLTINGASVVFEGATANDFETTVTVTDPTADRTITLPDASGTVGLLGSIALGTDTTGNYVSGVSAGTGVTVTHTPAEGSTATIAIGQAVGTNSSPSFADLTLTGSATAINFVPGVTEITASGGTTSLTSSSNYRLIVNGSSAQTVRLPLTSTLTVGESYIILNNTSSSAITVQTSAGATITTMYANEITEFTCISTSANTVAAWSINYTGANALTGLGSAVRFFAPTLTAVTIAPFGGPALLLTGDLAFEGSTANDFETTITVVDPTADRTITIPDLSGTIGFSGLVASDSKGANQASISTITDITNLTLSYTAVAGHTYMVTVLIPVTTQQTSAGTQYIYLTDGSDTILAQQGLTVGSGSTGHFNFFYVETPTAGSKTRKARASTTAGTMTVAAATETAWIYVEDIT